MHSEQVAEKNGGRKKKSWRKKFAVQFHKTKDQSTVSDTHHDSAHFNSGIDSIRKITFVKLKLFVSSYLTYLENALFGIAI